MNTTELTEYLFTLRECLDLEVELRGSRTQTAHDLRTLIINTEKELETQYHLGWVNGEGKCSECENPCTHDWYFINGDNGEMKCAHCGECQN
jgi:hypothetical protein